MSGLLSSLGSNRCSISPSLLSCASFTDGVADLLTPVSRGKKAGYKTVDDLAGKSSYHHQHLEAYPLEISAIVGLGGLYSTSAPRELPYTLLRRPVAAKLYRALNMFSACLSCQEAYAST
jgi:hypothetical protein